ncbi:MAG TPA: hypothetical protein VEH49_07450, partial [Methylomirabilota bacterium]|nr:hypothetical protein [Methylomirabilota bacterium]
CLAMVAYGWTFHAGFFNYYLSVGLAFWGLAIFLWGKDGKRYLALALAPLILLAHPMGLVWFLGALAYIAIAGRIAVRLQIFLLAAPAAMLAWLRSYLWNHFRPDEVDWPKYLYQGADQLALSTSRHVYVAAAALAFGTTCVLLDFVKRRKEPRYLEKLGTPLQLYFILEMAVFFLPDTLFLPIFSNPFGWIIARLTLISAVLGCSILAAVKPRPWHAAGFTIIAVVFFFLNYRETTPLNQMEQQVERLLDGLPRNARLLETILPRPESRLYFVDHVVDHACIRRCFAFENYEPASKQFRVRAGAGNAIVLADAGDVGDAEEGTYEVPQEILPAFQVYQCGKEFSQLCLRTLRAGEKNDRLGLHPERNDD